MGWDSAASDVVGYTAEEIDPTSPTRTSRLKWVVVVDDSLPAGRAVNAAVCVAAATARAVGGLLGDDATDADGGRHPGLPWAGCSVLTAPAATIRAIRDRAVGTVGCYVADMPATAQHTRIYADYLAAVKETPTDALEYFAVSVIGPRKQVDRTVGKLSLM